MIFLTLYFMLVFFVTSLVGILALLIILSLAYKFLYRNQEYYKFTSIDDAIIITGCDSGIGLELAKYFHKSEEFRIICGFLNPIESAGYKELSNLSQIDERDRLILRKLDITSSKDIADLIEFIDDARDKNSIKRLIALINNAGTMTYGEFDWLTWDHIQNQVEVNLLGTLRLTRAIVPYMIESKGRIVNVSSVNDTTVFPGLSIYSATKSALSTFSRGIGYELRKFGIHVVTIRLGDFARLTNIMARHSSDKDDMWQEMSSKKKFMYRDFFREFNQHLLNNYGMTSPREFQASSLFQDFRRALFSNNPPTTIVCAPFTFKAFYFLIELTPVWLQYHLIDLLIQFGFRWNPPQINTQSFEHL